MNSYAFGIIIVCLGLGGGTLLTIGKNYRKHMFLITVAITFLAAIVIYHNYLLGNAPFLYSVSDGFAQFLPIYTDFEHTIQDGNGLTLWNFSIGFGATQSYAKMFYPTNLFPILAGIIWNEQALMICAAWMQVFKIVFAAIFMFLFLRKLKFNDFVCCNMAVLYAFCGVLIVRGHWWLLGDECYIAAFILWSAECYFREKKWYFIPLSVALLAGCFGGYYLYLYGLELFIYGTVRYIYDKKTLKGYFKFILACGGLYILGALMMGVLLFDYGRSLLGTARYSSTRGYAQSSTFIELADVNVLISAIFSMFDVSSTGVFHLYTGALNYLERPILYCGLCCMYLIPQGFLLGKRKTKKLMSGGIIAVCIYMLFPIVTDVFNLFIKNEELGLRSYRMSALWIVIMIIVMAGYGLQCGLEKGAFSKKGSLITGIVLITVFVACIFCGARFEATIDYNVCRWVILFLVIWMIYFCTFGWKIKKGNLIMGGELLLICISVLEAGHSARVTINGSLTYAAQSYAQMQEDPLGYYSDVSGAVDYIKEYDNGFYRVGGLRPGLGVYCSPLYFGIYDSSYYTNIDSKTYAFLEEVYPESFINNLGAKYSIGVGNDLHLSTLTSYKYLIVPEGQKEEIPYGYELLDSIESLDIYKNRNALPIGIAYDSYVKETVFQKYSDEEQRKILLHCVVLKDDEVSGLREVTQEELDKFLVDYTYADYDASVSQRLKDKFIIDTWKDDNITGHIKASKDGVVVFSIPNISGWNVYVDGVKDEKFDANIGFIAITLTEGEHLVKLEYSPPAFRLSIVISIMALMVYILILIIDIKCLKSKTKIL